MIWTITFYSDKERTTPVDPTDVDLLIKKPDGSSDSATITDLTGTGKFQGEYVVDQYGTWEWRWETSSPTIVAQGEIFVIQRNV